MKLKKFIKTLQALEKELGNVDIIISTPYDVGDTFYVTDAYDSGDNEVIIETE